MTSSRDNWERLVAAVIKRDQIRQLCHQDSITSVDSDFSEPTLTLISVSSTPISPELPLERNSTVQDDYFGVESFSLHEIQVATDHFSNRNIVDHGESSVLYKGWLADGSLVAVKKYKEIAVSEERIKEELEISSTIVAHQNVIGVRGFCITEKLRLLVYPYMTNGSVAQYLGARGESLHPLYWAMKERIAVGVARGIAHLHNGCIRSIIHRDIKAANILLDDDFEPLVSGFSLAEFADYNNDDPVLKTTFGHIAPEYHSTRKYSMKSDVYDYGIFLLELITGRRISDLAWLAYYDYMELLDWVTQLMEEKKCGRMVDQGREGEFDEDKAEKFVRIALICTQTYPDEHPTMSEVVMILEEGLRLTENQETFSTNICWHGSNSNVSEDELDGPR